MNPLTPTHIHTHPPTPTPTPTPWHGGMNSHLVVHKHTCEPPAQCNSPSATNGYSCPSLMPGSISTSKTFSSGTNLKHKQQCYTQTFHSQLKGQKELGLGHTQTFNSQLKRQKELELGHTQTFNSQLKRQKELEQGQNCLLVPIQKEDDVLRRKKIKSATGLPKAYLGSLLTSFVYISWDSWFVCISWNSWTNWQNVIFNGTADLTDRIMPFLKWSVPCTYIY